MNYNIDWSKSPKDWSTQVVIGIYKPHPSITFTIRKHLVRWSRELGKDVWSITYSRELGKDVWSITYSVDYDIQGNTSGIVLNTQEEVITYLDHQTSLLPEYLALIGKRDKLSERIRPLKNKWFKYASQLHDLAKTK